MLTQTHYKWTTIVRKTGSSPVFCCSQTFAGYLISVFCIWPSFYIFLLAARFHCMIVNLLQYLTKYKLSQKPGRRLSNWSPIDAMTISNWFFDVYSKKRAGHPDSVWGTTDAACSVWFEEVLWAMDEKPIADAIEDSFVRRNSMPASLYLKSDEAFREYMLVGICLRNFFLLPQRSDGCFAKHGDRFSDCRRLWECRPKASGEPPGGKVVKAL